MYYVEVHGIFEDVYYNEVCVVDDIIFSLVCDFQDIKNYIKMFIYGSSYDYFTEYSIIIRIIENHKVSEVCARYNFKLDELDEIDIKT